MDNVISFPLPEEPDLFDIEKARQRAAMCETVTLTRDQFLRLLDLITVTAEEE